MGHSHQFRDVRDMSGLPPIAAVLSQGRACRNGPISAATLQRRERLKRARADMIERHSARGSDNRWDLPGSLPNDVSVSPGL